MRVRRRAAAAAGARLRFHVRVALRFSVLQPQGSFNWKESFIPQITGKRTLVAVMSSANLCEVK